MNRRIVEITLMLVALSFGRVAAEGLALPASHVPTRFVQVQTGLQTAQNAGDPSPATILNASRTGLPNAGGAVTELDISSLLNRHWRTTGRTVLDVAGKSVTISGSFDQDQNAYVSLLIEGQATPIFYDLALLATEGIGEFKIGQGDFFVYVAANAAKPLKSRVIIEDAAEDEVGSVKVGHLLDAVVAAGEAVQVTGQEYRVFYFSDVIAAAPSRGVTNPATLSRTLKTYAFIYKEVTQDAEELHVFLIPASQVTGLPAGKVAEYKMFNNKRIGLRADGNKLQIHDLP